MTWAAVRPGAALQSAALTAGTTASETIKVTALTAAPALPGSPWLADPGLWSNARAAVRMYMHRRAWSKRPLLPPCGREPIYDAAGLSAVSWRGSYAVGQSLDLIGRTSEARST